MAIRNSFEQFPKVDITYTFFKVTKMQVQVRDVLFFWFANHSNGA